MNGRRLHYVFYSVRILLVKSVRIQKGLLAMTTITIDFFVIVEAMIYIGWYEYNRELVVWHFSEIQDAISV